MRIPDCLTEDAIDSLVIPVNEVAAHCDVENEVLLGVAIDMFAEFVRQCEGRSGDSKARFVENASRYVGLGMFCNEYADRFNPSVRWGQES